MSVATATRPATRAARARVVNRSRLSLLCPRIAPSPLCDRFSASARRTVQRELGDAASVPPAGPKAPLGGDAEAAGPARLTPEIDQEPVGGVADRGVMLVVFRPRRTRECRTAGRAAARA